MSKKTTPEMQTKKCFILKQARTKKAHDWTYVDHSEFDIYHLKLCRVKIIIGGYGKGSSLTGCGLHVHSKFTFFFLLFFKGQSNKIFLFLYMLFGRSKKTRVECMTLNNKHQKKSVIFVLHYLFFVW